MVAVNKNKPVGKKSDDQQRKENMRNKQSCSMRYRQDVKVSLADDPWDEDKGES